MLQLVNIFLKNKLAKQLAGLSNQMHRRGSNKHKQCHRMAKQRTGKCLRWSFCDVEMRMDLSFFGGKLAWFTLCSGSKVSAAGIPVGNPLRADQRFNLGGNSLDCLGF
jgi:hypothetical protein